MSIKIKKDGQVREFILPATNIQVLDMADKFKKKDLENVIKEISDTEHIYVGEVDETKDGIWIDDGEILDNAENNGVVERIKEYVDGQIKDYSNPNLLINGDFQIWSKGTSFTNVSLGYTADRWSIYSESNVNVSKTDNGLKFKPNVDWGYLIYCFDDKTFNEIKGKNITLTIKTTKGIMSKAFSFKQGDDWLELGGVPNTVCIFSYRNKNLQFYIDGEVDIEYVKLEYGNKATPFIPKKYHEELLACNDGIIGSNPNLLINGDFQVWQRGTSFHQETETYCVDRWLIWGDTHPKVEKTNNGVKITSTRNGGWTNFFTKLENATLKKLIGKTLTYTIKLKVPTRISQVWALTGSTGGLIYHHNKQYIDKNYEYLTGSFVVESTQFDDNGYFEIGIQGIPEANNSFEIEYAKLELGSVATPYSPRPYAEELALCQRYYCTEDWSSANVPRVLYKVSEDYQDRGLICFPTEMRITPTINLVWGDNVINNSSYVGNKGIDSLTSKSFVPFVNRTGEGVNNKQFVPSVKSYTADAEIY